MTDGSSNGQPATISPKEVSQPIRDELKEINDNKWWKTLLLPFVAYFPAFLLVIVAFLCFRFPNTGKPESSATLTPVLEEKIRETVKNQISSAVTPDLENRVRKTVADQLALENIVDQAERSRVAQEYVQKLIKVEVQDQSGKSAKDEVDKLKADWKGDLFGQISFPVIFAIASIFAAFAVKDILTEILKRDEKDKLENDIRKNLQGRLFEKVKEQRLELEGLLEELTEKKIKDTLDLIERKVDFLEYETASLTALQPLISRSSYQVAYEQNLILDSNARVIQILCNLIEKRPKDEQTPLLELALRYELEELPNRLSNSDGLSGEIPTKIKSLDKELQGDKKAYDIGKELLDTARHSMSTILEIKVCWLYELLKNASSTANPEEKSKLDALMEEIFKVNIPLRNIFQRLDEQKIATERNVKNDSSIKKLLGENELPKLNSNNSD